MFWDGPSTEPNVNSKFCLFLLQTLLTEVYLGNGAVMPTTVILAPTRELSIQIRDDAIKMTYRSFVRPKIAYGGTSVSMQAGDILRGCEMLVATPGRLMDFIQQNVVSLEKVGKTDVLFVCNMLITRSF
jgi:superfamily II DNA/RNA helicase